MKPCEPFSPKRAAAPARERREPLVLGSPAHPLGNGKDALAARNDLERRQIALQARRPLRVVEIGAEQRRQAHAARSQRPQDEDSLHLAQPRTLPGRSLRGRRARLVHEPRRIGPAEIEVEQQSLCSGSGGERVRKIGRGRELEAIAEEARKTRQVLVAVLADDPARLHALAPCEGKHAPTALRKGGSSERTTTCPAHSRVRSRTMARPRPLSRDSISSRVMSPGAESPTRSTCTLRPAASRSSPRRTSTRPPGAAAACAFRSKLAKMVASASRSTGNSTAMPWSRTEGAVQPAPPRRTSASTPWIQSERELASTRVRGPWRKSDASRGPCTSRMRESMRASSLKPPPRRRIRSAAARSRTRGPKTGSRQRRRKTIPCARASSRSRS